MKVQGVQKKICVRCNRALAFDKFYPNRDWTSQRYRDAWCKDCAQDYCKDKETLKRYCFENNRQWHDRFWDTAIKKAQYSVNTDPEYTKPKASEKKKEEILNRAACRAFFSMMNLIQFYYYIDNSANENYVVGNNITDEDQHPLQPVNGGSINYNKTWGGRFTDEDIEWLEDYYAKLKDDFVLDNVNAQDYARKVAKASLNANIAEDKMRRGVISQKEYKEAQEIFDDLSKSANFAACRRKPGEASGMGSLGEIILRLEVSGELNTNPYTFPPDDIDRIVADFDHTYRAIGADVKL